MTALDQTLKPVDYRPGIGIAARHANEQATSAHGMEGLHQRG
jgi:hypothetical protein